MTIKNRLNRLGVRDIDVIEKDESVSTNTDCKQYITGYAPHKSVLITAKTQSGGRGRQGKHFSSPEGGLYMSLLTRPGTALSNTVRITAAASVAVCRAIRETCGLRCSVKWVNDIYADGKKLCGILTEAVNDYTKNITDYLIIGVGVNLTVYPEGLNATSLLREMGNPPDKAELCARITAELLHVLEQIKAGDYSYMEEYRASSCVIGKNVRCIRDNVPFRAKAVEIDDNGGLVLLFPDGHTETLTSGEITLRVEN